jgi:hypothetical protein
METMVKDSKDMDEVVTGEDWIGIELDMMVELVMEVKVEICSRRRGRGDGSSSKAVAMIVMRNSRRR